MPTADRKPFDQDACDAYLSILGKIAENPPSSATIDPELVSLIQAFLHGPNPKIPVGVWNFYKEILDLTVHGSLGSSFIVQLLDLEPFLIAPEGAFSQEAGNMDQAPWRKALGG